ncbi:MAG: CHRD domain-containing protein [Chloroflexi bacterium]|nr:CHRD domain-containing protein [Chloroflexota bacterium]
MRRLSVLWLMVLAMLATVGVAAAANSNYVAHLAARNEIPPAGVVIASLAQGQAIYQLSEDGTAFHYKLNVANIENVVAAHIHLGASTVNGPVVAFLYGPAAPGGGRTNGVLAEGTITAANLVGPLARQPLSALIAAMEAGNTYTNVHTNDGVAPTNTGAGDFPGGEIRGQIH